MRTVIVLHKDARERTEYSVFETEGEARLHNPNTRIVKLSEAETGDLVFSDNGWIVPLLSKAILYDKYLRGAKRKIRLNAFRYVVFNFPKDRKVFREDHLQTALFNYNPMNYNGIASDDKRCRMYELSPRKIQWAQLVKHGVDPLIATRQVYPTVHNANKLTKNLLINPKIADYIYDQQYDLAHQLRSRKFSVEELAANLITTINDEQAPVKLKLWALNKVYEAFNSEPRT